MIALAVLVKVIDTSGDVEQMYTYGPFGNLLEYDGTFLIDS